MEVLLKKQLFFVQQQMSLELNVESSCTLFYKNIDRKQRK
jgi:hypothetical protein